MRRAALVLPLIALASCSRFAGKPAVNPDPNHAHADFAVWVNGTQLDFSGEKYMMTEEEEAKLPSGDLRHYLHLHDGNGHVIHRHKPDLSLKEFFASLGWKFIGKDGIILNDGTTLGGSEGRHDWRMFINGHERTFDLDYVFADGDQILLSYARLHDPEDADIYRQLKLMTRDACLYSQTCPERGKPPTESCIADPAVPCTQ